MSNRSQHAVRSLIKVALIISIIGYLLILISVVVLGGLLEISVAYFFANTGMFLVSLSLLSSDKKLLIILRIMYLAILSLYLLWLII